MSAPIVLRDLPDVQRLEELCRNPRNFEYPKEGYAKEWINRLSNRLFCIDEADTYWEEEEGDDPAEVVEYNDQYKVAALPWPESKPFWDAIGWDITDGRGEELLCAHFLTRQIIACVGDLVDGAKFCPNGDGTPAYDAWTGERIDDDKRWEEALTREAERFMEGKIGESE